MIVVDRHVQGRHRPDYLERCQVHAWMVRERPVQRRRRSRRVVLQLAVDDLVVRAGGRPLPRPWWRRLGAWLVAFLADPPS